MRELKIGEQVWTIDNLDITTYRNGDPIPNVQDPKEWNNLKSGAWCSYENKDGNNLIYGKIYNYPAIVDPRGLAPEGYRIPQHYDWLLLKKFVSRLKSKDNWNEKKELDYYIPFNAKLGGYCDGGGFSYINEAIGWWASPESDVKNQGKIAHWVYKNDTQLGWKPFFENDGFYVRCIKEAYKTINFYLNDNLQLHYKSIAIKYSASTTFQEILNRIYAYCLKGTVNAHSYGRDWTIEIYNGEGIGNLDKTGNIDNRIFEDILKYQYNKYRLIVSRR